MFFHGLLGKFLHKIKIELSFLKDILLPEQVKKLVHSVNKSAHDIGLAHLLFVSFPPVSKIREKLTLYHLHTLYIRT